MRTDVLYLCHGRLEFTIASLMQLLDHTDWSPVNDLIVYNDATPDRRGETSAFVREALADAGLGTFRETNLGSPVAVMNHYLNRSVADRFAKIDNDIIVGTNWLTHLSAVMDEYPDLDLLGMEPGMSGCRAIDDPLATAVYGYTPASHIGGVGLMRCEAFERYGFPEPNGRFGFTEWQHTFQPRRGWIQPDLRTFALDCVPRLPWCAYAATYKQTSDLQRDWPQYKDPSIYDWWTG